MGKQVLLPPEIDRSAKAVVATGNAVELSTEDYIAQTISQLEDLASLIDVAKERVTCDDLFHQVIRRTLETTDHYPETLAKELAVSNSTISRWMNRFAAPHPAKKPWIYKQITKICKKETRVLRKKSHTA